MAPTTAAEQVRCHILLTNTAREAMKQHVPDEHAFFNLQDHFYVYIEKLSVDETQLNLTLYFDPTKNKKLVQKFPDRIVIMDCIFDLKSGLLAKSFRTRGKGTPVATNRRVPMRINFVPTRINGHTYQDKFIQTLASLPVAQERFDYVNKRISSWEGYLQVLNKNADIEDINVRFSKMTFNGEMTHLTLRLSGVDGKQWKQLKGLSARMRGFVHEIGEVVKVNREEQTVEIELKPMTARQARKNELSFQSEDVEFSNASTKSQLKRLLKGFERLKEGLAANANLENILFEDKPVIAERKKDIEIDFHNNLNEFQRAAVTGAISAEDLYVIQGPPGTGKTTVISEICYQNAKAGLKTLVASQSNLAVDNALSRLLSNKDIRILRYGRTESIEEEGKKFIEENVATYWQKQTYEAISHEIELQTDKEDILLQEISTLEKKQAELALEEQQLEQQIIDKEAAKAELHVLAEQISSLKKELATCKRQREETETTLAELIQRFEAIETVVTGLQHQLTQLPSMEEMQSLASGLVANEATVKRKIHYLHKQAELTSIENGLMQIDSRLSRMQETLKYEGIIEKIADLKKVNEIESFMATYEIRRSYVMDRLLTALGRIQPDLEQYKPLKAIVARLDKAIIYSETKLGIHVEPSNLPMSHSYSLNEVDEFLTKLSKAFAQKLVTAANGTRSVQGLHLRKQYLHQVNDKYKEHIRETVLIFEKLKEEIGEQFKQQNSTKLEETVKLKQHKQQLVDKQVIILADIQEPLVIQETTQQLEHELGDIQLKQSELQRKRNSQQTFTAQHASKELEMQQLQEQITAGTTMLEQQNEQFKAINVNGLTLEKRREELEQLTKLNPELALENVQKQFKVCQSAMSNIQLQIAMLPVTQELQGEWQQLLADANAHDLDEIRKLYVKHANVIGTTCVASANKEFMDNYPTFDVVIIDEVSKATPPELLLPMLKGAKIILVGDHHQLPPLVGDDTFEETLEQVIKESNTFEQKRELEKMLEESLFERLYKNLPATNKTMLAIQYRMHEKIMQTIAPFYKNENDELQCGLTDSDGMRDHQLESELLTRQDHLLWLDLPNDRNYFEERMKGGSSLFNAGELMQIKALLVDLNAATARAKDEGRIPQEALKSVGVISFYAEQVKRINRLIEQEIDIPHLHIRTGSVDKFQGMEMDIILVSMVRNNANKHGDIGFAKDYRRLNVALSRARELLVLIGSTEMFTKRPKQPATREMYAELLEIVQQQNGYRGPQKVTV